MVSICETRPDGEEQPPSASGVQGSDRLPIVLTAHCGRHRIWVAASARRAGVRGPLGRMLFDALQQNAGACVNQFESFVMLRRLRDHHHCWSMVARVHATVPARDVIHRRCVVQGRTGR